MARANAPYMCRSWAFPRSPPKKAARAVVLQRRRLGGGFVGFEKPQLSRRDGGATKSRRRATGSLLKILFIVGRLLPRNFQRQTNASRAQVFQDGLPVFQGNCSGRKNPGGFTRKMLDEQSRHLRGGIGHGRQGQSALSNLIERREKSVATNLDSLILLDAAYYDGCREPRVLQYAFADQSRDLPRRRRFGKPGGDQSTGTREFPLPVPTPQAVDFVAADFHVHFLEGKKMGHRADFILRRQHDRCFSNGRGKAKFLRFSKPLAEAEFTASHNAWARYGLVEGNFGRPLRNRVVAFGAFVKANVDFFHGVHHCGGPGHQEIRQSRGGAGYDYRGALLFLEAAVETKLLGLKWIACQVRAQVQIMRANAQRRAQNDLIKDGSRRVNQQLRATSGAHNAPEISRVHLNDRNFALLAEKMMGAVEVPVTTGDLMPLADQQVCEVGAGCSGSQDEDAHWGKTVSYSLRLWSRATWEPKGAVPKTPWWSVCGGKRRCNERE